jgi:release factor glutamine methyltransferase
MHAEVLARVESILQQAGIGNPARDALAIIEAAKHLADKNNHLLCALAMAADRAAGTPLGYVTGRVHFMALELSAAPGALVPRDETELLGWTALRMLNDLATDGELRLIDMCCGSGNLVCGITSYNPNVRAWASDLTDDAVRLARLNVRRLQLSKRVDVMQGDLFDALSGCGLEGTIDMIVCNPPYISSGRLEGDRAELLTHEPRAAFDGGPFGVSIFQRVVRNSLLFLKPGGTLLFEIGLGQERQVPTLFERAAGYDRVTTVNDCQGQPRVIAGRRRMV